MIKRFEEKVIGAILFVIIGKDDFIKFSKDKGIDPHDDLDCISGCADHFDMKMKSGSGKKRHYYIYLAKKGKLVLVHELVHFVHFVFDYREIFYDCREDEIFAYYYEYWFKVVYKFLWGKK